MNYLLYPFLVVYNLFMTVACLILSPVLPIFAVEKEWWLDNHAKRGIGPVLPSWLNLFNTPDNTLDGDATFERLNGIGYWQKARWLRRNPAYSFALRYLNAPYETTVYGDKTIKDNDQAKAGWCFVRVNNLFQFRYIKRIANTNRCVLVNFGWNIMGVVDDNVNPKPNSWQSTFVFSPRISGFR